MKIVVQMSSVNLILHLEPFSNREVGHCSARLDVCFHLSHKIRTETFAELYNRSNGYKYSRKRARALTIRIDSSSLTITIVDLGIIATLSFQWFDCGYRVKF